LTKNQLSSITATIAARNPKGPRNSDIPAAYLLEHTGVELPVANIQRKMLRGRSPRI
jgi:hypothetical protein